MLRGSDEVVEDDSVWKGSIDMQEAHRLMSESCIAYLSLGVLTTQKFTALTAVFNKSLAQAQNKLSDGSLPPDQFLGQAYSACHEFTADFDLTSFSVYALQHWLTHFNYAQEFVNGVFVRDIDSTFDAAYFGLFDVAVPITAPVLVMAAQTVEEDCGYQLTEFDKTSGMVRCHNSVNLVSLASVFGHHRLLDRLLKRGVPGNEMSPGIETNPLASESPVVRPPSLKYQPVFFVAAAGHWNSLPFILSEIDYKGAVDQVLRTPLHQAARLGRYKCLICLADKFDLDQRDIHGQTALDYLIRRIDGIEDLDAARNALRVLIQVKGEGTANADTANAITANGQRRHEISLLALAAKSPNETFLERRYSLGSVDGPERAQDIRSSRLFQAAFEGSLIKLLVDNGEDPDHPEPEADGFYPLHFAAKGHFWNTLFLLRAGASVSPVDAMRRTPLHLACTLFSSASFPLISVLLEHGASPNDADIFGLTPFIFAVTYPQYYVGEAMVKLMLAHGANPHQRIRGGGLPPGSGKGLWHGDSPLDIARRQKRYRARLDMMESWLLDTSLLW